MSALRRLAAQPWMCRLLGHKAQLSASRDEFKASECPRCHRTIRWSYDRQMRRWFRSWA